MGTTSSLRIDDELYASAKLVAAVSRRSAAQQIEYWAAIGREVEASRQIAARDIEEVLAGESRYDDLLAREKALVRAEWSQRIDRRLESLDLAAAFAAEGRPYVELGEDGTVVERSAE